MDDLVKTIGALIKGFQQTLEEQLPLLKSEVYQLIENKSTDSMKIENYLDTLLSLSMHGVGDDIFIALLEYYKTIDETGARFYWNEYDNLED